MELFVTPAWAEIPKEEEPQKAQKKPESDRVIYGKKRKTVPVSVYTLDGEYITTYPTIYKAAKAHNTAHGSIRKCLIGKRLSHLKCQFKFAEILEFRGEKFAKKTNIAPYDRSQRAQCVPVIQYDKYGNKIAEYKSMKDAGLAIGVTHQGICNQVYGRTKTVKGYKFVKKENNNILLR